MADLAWWWMICFEIDAEARLVALRYGFGEERDKLSPARQALLPVLVRGLSSEEERNPITAAIKWLAEFHPTLQRLPMRPMLEGVTDVREP